MYSIHNDTKIENNIETNDITSLWTIKNTKLLIELRITHDKLFEDSLQNIEGWNAVLFDMILTTTNTNYNVDIVRRKWENINKIYKDFSEFLSTQTNVWPYYDILDTFYKYKSNNNYLQSVCRLCQKDDELFEIKKGSKLSKIIKKYLKITVSKDPKNFPKHICSYCKLKVEEFHSFKLRCQKINRKLNLILKNVTSDETETDRNKINLLEDVPIDYNDHQSLSEDEEINTSHRSEGLEKIDAQFLCSTCGEEFKSVRRLKVHEKRHSGIKDYSCKECNAKFYSSPSLMNHYKKIHLKLRYLCNKCPKMFRSYSSLHRHNIVHSGVKKFSCTICDMKYFTQKEVNSHTRRIHGGQKKLSCSVCYKKFFTNSELTIHMRYHTGERPFECDYPGCDKKYADKFKLRFHVKKKHKDTNNETDSF